MGRLSELHEEIRGLAEARDDVDLLDGHLDDVESRVAVGTRELGVVTLVVNAHLQEWWIEKPEEDTDHGDLIFTYDGFRVGPGPLAGGGGGPRELRTLDLPAAAGHLFDRAVTALGA